MRRTFQRATPTAASVALLLCVSCATLADPPPQYYDSVNATNSATLRTTLHAVIADHQWFPYTSGSTDTCDILELADEDGNRLGHAQTLHQTQPQHGRRSLPSGRAASFRNDVPEL